MTQRWCARRAICASEAVGGRGTRVARPQRDGHRFLAIRDLSLKATLPARATSIADAIAPSRHGPTALRIVPNAAGKYKILIQSRVIQSAVSQRPGEVTK